MKFFIAKNHFESDKCQAKIVSKLVWIYFLQSLKQSLILLKNPN